MTKVVGVLLLAVMLGTTPAFAARPATTVEQIGVAVTVSPAVSPQVLRRIEASIKTVGQRLLHDRSVAAIAADREEYEALIQDVLDRVLYGYTVSKVTLMPATKTGITVVLTAWDERIEQVGININFFAADAQVLPLLEQDLGDLDQAIAKTLVGLPIDALVWAEPVIAAQIRELVQLRLPEYQPTLTIVGGRQTLVTVAFAPSGELVREVEVSHRSGSVPNMLLYQMNPALESYAKSLRGLPVGFLYRKQPEIIAEIEQLLLRNRYTRQFRLTSQVELTAAETTMVQVQTDSSSYRINLEGWLDLSSNNSSTTGRLHAGKFVTAKDELFLELRLISTMHGQISAGWGHQLGRYTAAGVRLGLNDNRQIGWLEQQFGRNWQIKLEHSLKTNERELSLRYKFHDFLSAELVNQPDENFIRLVGHL